MNVVDVDVNGDNLLAASLRHGLRTVAAEHAPEHPAPVEGCEGCEMVEAAKLLRTTQAEDDERWSA